ncbi:uncharacterized protein [Miscanthus floridulus]|uniref:uncharacterized protein n=1 Tax=Miscanthus floridulus TaxID=154761 RepID=UPI003458357B
MGSTTRDSRTASDIAEALPPAAMRQGGGEYAAVVGVLVNVNPKELESRSVEHGPELPGGGRSGQSTSKKVVGHDASAGDDDVPASSSAVSGGDARSFRGEATVAEIKEMSMARKAPKPDSGNNARNSRLDYINWEEEIKFDPGLRKQIDDYHPNVGERVRRKYLKNGPCQPRTVHFPVTNIGGIPRREKKDGGYEAFVKNGWNGYHRKERLQNHVGNVGGSHYLAMKKCDDLLQTKQHIDVAFRDVSESAKKDYFTRLNGSIDVARILVKQGLPFRGHDESNKSLNKGNFREFRNFAEEQNLTLRKAVDKKNSDNSLLIAPEIQKDIVHCFAKEVLHSILEEIGDDVFCLLVDESRDVSWKEQMAVVLRYVDKCRIVKERFVDLVHVKETHSASLKSAIDALFADLKLSLKQVRGQGYDGASNMRGITNTLSLALQRKDQDIVNAIKCVKATKCQLDELRKEKWVKLLDDVHGFCDKNDICKLEMEDEYIDPKKRRHKSGITNKHYYQVDCFNDVIDCLLQELDSRFNETGSQLLVCSAAFSPRDSFHDFSIENLMSLVKLYPHDFDSGNLRDLNHELGLYIYDVRDDERFSNLQIVVELSQTMVKRLENTNVIQWFTDF